MSAIPPAPGGEAPRTLRRGLWAVAAAAVILLGIGVGSGRLGVGAQRGEQSFQAPLVQESAQEERGRASVHTDDEKRGAVNTRVDDRATIEEVLEPQVGDEEDAETMPDALAPAASVVEEPDPSVARRSPPGSRRGAAEERDAKSDKGGKPSLDDELKALDEDAQKKWREGDLPGAEELFRELIRRGGRRARVQLAYGDLFALVRQRHGVSGEESVWREYLERFPKGRHADDARAGLCRRANGARQRECWERYLEDFSRGAHRSLATRALAEQSTATPEPKDAGAQ